MQNLGTFGSTLIIPRPRGVFTWLLSGALVAPMLGTGVSAKVVTQAVPYQHGEVALEGYLAYDDSVKEKRPGVLVVHEWWGLNDFAKQKARELAELGYVALAVDMYGKGVLAQTAEEAGKLAGQFRGNLQLWRDRARAAYDVLSQNEHVDPKRIAAIGFCFGGSTVMQLAESGADLAAVVSFHGGLMPLSTEDAARAKGKWLILHGAADTTMKPETVQAFQDSLSKSKLDWQMVIYSGAKHGFTNPEVDKLRLDGIGYNQVAADRSWRQMRMLFDEVFRSVGR